MSDDEKNDVNPYAPPSSDVNGGKVPPAMASELAEPGTRLAAHFADSLLAGVLMLPAIIAGFQSGALQAGSKLEVFRNLFGSGIGLLSGLACLALLLYQAYLVTKTGQSVGKHWLKIKIVKLDGSPAGFVSGVLLRSWLFAALQYVPFPVAPAVLGLADPLLIFRADRRCLHDLTAGTKVVQLRGEAQIRVA